MAEEATFASERRDKGASSSLAQELASSIEPLVWWRQIRFLLCCVVLCSNKKLAITALVPDRATMAHLAVLWRLNRQEEQQATQLERALNGMELSGGSGTHHRVLASSAS